MAINHTNLTLVLVGAETKLTWRGIVASLGRRVSLGLAVCFGNPIDGWMYVGCKARNLSATPRMIAIYLELFVGRICMPPHIDSDRCSFAIYVRRWKWFYDTRCAIEQIFIFVSKSAEFLRQDEVYLKYTFGSTNWVNKCIQQLLLFNWIPAIKPKTYTYIHQLPDIFTGTTAIKPSSL